MGDHSQYEGNIILNIIIIIIIIILIITIGADWREVPGGQS